MFVYSVTCYFIQRIPFRRKCKALPYFFPSRIVSLEAVRGDIGSAVGTTAFGPHARFHLSLKWTGTCHTTTTTTNKQVNPLATPDAWSVQNCTDHAVMLLTHPNRKYKPPRPRAGRFHRRAPAAGDGGEGPSPWGATAASHDDLHVGGKTSFPGTFISSRSGWGKGDPGALSDAARGVAAEEGVAEGDVTLVEPGKVRGCCRENGATHRLIRGLELKRGSRIFLFCLQFRGFRVSKFP